MDIKPEKYIIAPEPIYYKGKVKEIGQIEQEGIMNKFEEQYYKQTRNEMEGYQKERIFVDVETAVEAIKETAIRLNDKEYVGFTRDMAEQIKKAYELKEKGEER